MTGAKESPAAGTSTRFPQSSGWRQTWAERTSPLAFRGPPMAAWRMMDVGPDPPAIFLDTSYVNAPINTRDQWHPVAVEWERHLASARRKLLTTEFILVEIADGLAA